jgi:hypothetical protein
MLLPNPVYGYTRVKRPTSRPGRVVAAITMPNGTPDEANQQMRPSRAEAAGPR